MTFLDMGGALWAGARPKGRTEKRAIELLNFLALIHTKHRTQQMEDFLHVIDFFRWLPPAPPWSLAVTRDMNFFFP